MKSLEFFRNISIGQYIDIASPMHALHPAAKFALLFCISILALTAPTFTGAGAALLVAVLCILLARLPLSMAARPLKSLLYVAVLTILLQFLFSWPGDQSLRVLSLGKSLYALSLTLYETGIVASIVIRAAAMMLTLGWFTSIITEQDAIRSIERFLRRALRDSTIAHQVALVSAMALRFVPIIAGELEDIVKAQASRGASFGSDTRNPIAKARAYLPLFVPVTIRALERAELLAEAMEARCYTGRGRTEQALSPIPKSQILLILGAVLATAALWWVDLTLCKPWIRPY